MSGRPDIPVRHRRDTEYPTPVDIRTESTLCWVTRPHQAAPAQRTSSGSGPGELRPEHALAPDTPMPDAIPVSRAARDDEAEPPTGPIDTVHTPVRDDEFRTARGELPLSEAADTAERLAARRVRVSLTVAVLGREQPVSPGLVGAYSAPPGGLGKFDLGSIPASVTPPRTWRKAAWFATLSSTGVVVALLVAGTALVGGPEQRSTTVAGWTGHGDRVPPASGQGHPGGAETAAGAGGGTTAPEKDESGDDAAGKEADNRLPSARAPRAERNTSPETGESDGPSPEKNSTDGPPTLAGPRKPPVTVAAVSTAGRSMLAASGHDAETMAQRSQAYLNTVTENPAAAHALTTGELAEHGPGGLADRYTGIAYFEVEHVYVDTNKGYTLNNIRVTYQDGSTAEQTRKLVFADNGKIASDGA